MSEVSSVLVVGASAGGLATAEALRRKGYTGAITLLGAEPELPYDRPPLSKQVLSGAWEPERAQLRSAEQLTSLHARFDLGDPAVALDCEPRQVTTAAGRTLTADAIVIATGADAGELPIQQGVGGTHVLRDLGDALALRAELLRARRVAVIGDGVLGAETAATARAMSLHVTLVGPQPAPLTGQLGPLVASHLARLHARNGVELRSNVTPDSLCTRAGRVTGVRLSDGSELEADVVVTAVGCRPATRWLEDSTLDLDDGVVCDACCRAAPGVWAVGDVARWYHEGLGRHIRLENRTNASEQALAVAADILGTGRPYRPVPYFWTDQFDAKLQVYGLITADARAEIVEGDADNGRFVARYSTSTGPQGVVGWNMPKQTRLHRASVAARYTHAPQPVTP